MELSPYLTENWSKIKTEHLELILDLAEKLLNETIQTSLGHTKKAAWMFGIFSSLFIVIIGALIAKEIPEQFLISAYILLINIVFILAFTFRSQKKYSINIPGKRPEVLLDDDYFKSFESFENMASLAYKNTILNICRDYNDAIHENNDLNKRRLKNLEIARILILFLPIAAIVGYLLFLVL